MNESKVPPNDATYITTDMGNTFCMNKLADVDTDLTM